MPVSSFAVPLSPLLCEYCFCGWWKSMRLLSFFRLVRGPWGETVQAFVWTMNRRWGCGRGEHYRMLKNVPRYSLFPSAPEAFLDSWFSSVTRHSAWEGSCTFEGQARDAQTPQQSWQLRRKRVQKLLNYIRSYMLWTNHRGHVAYMRVTVCVSAPEHVTGSGTKYITNCCWANLSLAVQGLFS